LIASFGVAEFRVSALSVTSTLQAASSPADIPISEPALAPSFSPRDEPAQQELELGGIGARLTALELPIPSVWERQDELSSVFRSYEVVAPQIGKLETQMSTSELATLNATVSEVPAPTIIGGFKELERFLTGLTLMYSSRKLFARYPNRFSEDQRSIFLNTERQIRSRHPKTIPSLIGGNKWWNLSKASGRRFASQQSGSFWDIHQRCVKRFGRRSRPAVSNGDADEAIANGETDKA
jgi:hypothetical protein